PWRVRCARHNPRPTRRRALLHRYWGRPARAGPRAARAAHGVAVTPRRGTGAARARLLASVAMIRVIGEDAVGAVELLGEQDPGKARAAASTVTVPGCNCCAPAPRERGRRDRR